MATIAWDPRLDTGIDEIDAQHRQWLAILNDFLTVLEADGEREELGEIAARLLEYTREHFASEEAFLRSIDYPDLEAHREKHRAMAETAGCFAGPDGLASETDPHKMKQCLVGWLMGHVLSEDMRYVQYYRALSEKR